MEREGVYSPYSGIFSMNEPAHGYQWWSIVPRLSRDDLFRAEVVDDPTYLQLPADMPRRIRELAEDITDGERTPYAKAKALERYLKTRFAYVFGSESSKLLHARWDMIPSIGSSSRARRERVAISAARSSCSQGPSGCPPGLPAGWLIDARKESQVVMADSGSPMGRGSFRGFRLDHL